MDVNREHRPRLGPKDLFEEDLELLTLNYFIAEKILNMKTVEFSWLVDDSDRGSAWYFDQSRDIFL